MSGSPFDLQDQEAWQAWRRWKLEVRPRSVAELVVQVRDPFALAAEEKEAILDRCRRANMAVYQLAEGPGDREVVRAIGLQLGLRRLDHNLCADEDSITSLRVRKDRSRNEGYVPYSNRPLTWHTDGYYNLPEHTIRGLLLHCVRDAAKGGENLLLDHELVYLRLRDMEPRYIEALMAEDAMTIPPNIENGVRIRGARSGPVFSVDAVSGALHMRYSGRMRNIEWRDDPLTREAVEAMRELMDESRNPDMFRHRMQPGQGLICNNVLHNRTGFEDDEATGRTRLMLRARYYDRIADTGPLDAPLAA
ncbi:MAG TPA: taurine catabolism dioxygenase TauD [Thiotrichales bacterium]|nr:taurine catabolism dioxygenase TauD [Thiotrichales bacterium]